MKKALMAAWLLGMALLVGATLAASAMQNAGNTEPNK